MIFEGLEEGNVQRGEGRDRKGQRGDLLREASMRRGRKEGGELFQRAREMFFKAHSHWGLLHLSCPCSKASTLTKWPQGRGT